MRLLFDKALLELGLLPLEAASGVVSYKATSNLIINNATVNGLGTYFPGNFLAEANISISSVTVQGFADIVVPEFKASSSVSIGGITVSGNATFQEVFTYTANSSMSISNITSEGRVLAPNTEPYVYTSVAKTDEGGGSGGRNYGDFPIPAHHDGDLLILFVAGGSRTHSLPSGWTQIIRNIGPSNNGIHYKVGNGTENNVRVFFSDSYWDGHGIVISVKNAKIINNLIQYLWSITNYIPTGGSSINCPVIHVPGNDYLYLPIFINGRDSGTMSVSNATTVIRGVTVGSSGATVQIAQVIGGIDRGNSISVTFSGFPNWHETVRSASLIIASPNTINYFYGESNITTSNITVEASASFEEATTETYYGNSDNILNNFIVDAFAEFTEPVYTAYSNITTNNITASGQVDSTNPTYSAASDNTLNNITTNSYARFVNVVYKANSNNVIGKITVNGESRFIKPSYKVASSLQIGNISTFAQANHNPPDFFGYANLTIGEITAVGYAITPSVVYSADANLNLNSFSVLSYANFDAGTFNASSQIITNNIYLSSQAEFDAGAFKAFASLSIQNIICNATSTTEVPIYNAVGNIITSDIVVNSQGVHVPPDFFGYANLTIGKITAEGYTNTPSVIYSANSNITLGNISVLSYGIFDAGTFKASSQIVLSNITINSQAKSTNPKYNASSNISLKNIIVDADADSTALILNGYSNIILNNFQVNAFGLFDAGSFNASSTLSINNITSLGYVDNINPVYKASSNITLDNIICQGAVLTPSVVYRANGQLQIGKIYNTGYANFDAGTFVGSSQIQISNITVDAEADFTSPVYSASSNITLGKITCQGGALTPSVVYRANSAIELNNIYSAGYSTFDAGNFYGDSDISIGNIYTIGNAQVVNPAYKSAGSVYLNQFTLNAAAIFNTVFYSAESDITIGNFVSDAFGVFDAGEFNANASILLDNIYSESYASNIDPIYTASLDVSINSVILDAGALFIQGATAGFFAGGDNYLQQFIVNAFGNYYSSTSIGNSNITIGEFESEIFARFLGKLNANANVSINNFLLSAEAQSFGLPGTYVGESDIVLGSISFSAYATSYSNEEDTSIYYISEYVFGRYHMTTLIENNLKMYYDWSFLTIGGWTDVSIPTQQITAFDLSRLQPVDDPHYELGQVWEAPRRDFIYERNVNYKDRYGNAKNPFIIGYPYVDSLPVASGYYINYPFGQILFDEPIDINSVVQLRYSYRNVQIQKVGDLAWWQQLQFYAAGFDNDLLTKLRDGEWSIFGQKFQLPMIVIETSVADSNGWELGTFNRKALRKVNFHIYSESLYERNNLMDIINLQSDVRIPFLDINKMSTYNDFQLNYRGELNNSLQYPDLVEKYKYRMCHMKDSVITNISRINPLLYTATVQTNIDVII